MLMLLLMADGYTIIKGKMTSMTVVLFSIFFTVYVVAYATLYIVEANVSRINVKQEISDKNGKYRIIW